MVAQGDRILTGYQAIKGQIVPQYAVVNLQQNTTPPKGVTVPDGMEFVGYENNGKTPVFMPAGTPTSTGTTPLPNQSQLDSSLQLATSLAGYQREAIKSQNNPWNPGNLFPKLALGAVAAGTGLGILGSVPAGSAAAAGETGMSAGDIAGFGTFAPKAALTGALTGGAGGFAGGGGLKGALLGAGLGGLTGGFGGGLGTSLGLDGVGLDTFTGGLNGLAGGTASGNGLKGALIGTALGAGGGYLKGGGTLGGLFGSGSSDITSNAALGENGVLTSGAAGAAKSSSPSYLSGLFGGSGTSGASSYLQPLSTIYSGIQGTQAQNDIKKQLLAAQGKSAAALSPYTTSGAAANQQLSDRLASGFNPGDLSSDPGYQFQLEQGTKALNQSLAAKGGLLSGAAAKAAQDYGQGLASTTYDQRFSDWNAVNQQLAGQAGQGLNATGALTNVYDNQGNINANSTLQKSNIQNQTLSSLFGGGNMYSYLTPEQRKQLGLA